jgi:hypothetical protein
MKPQKTSETKTFVIKKEYWSCRCIECKTRHQTEDSAAKCKWHRPRQRLWTIEERAEVLKRHRNGETRHSIAVSYGISDTRIGQIINRAIQYEERSGRYEYLKK